MSIVTLSVTVLDCRDPQGLADFYAGLLDWQRDAEASSENWVEIAGEGGRLALQRSPGHQPPEWPGTERGQQLHLDFVVPEEQLDAAESLAVELGARLVQTDDEERRFRVYLDPAGHPFCLCPH